jgi:hydroxymethylbilane synthase
MLRGNIDSRLKRLQAKEFDGIILAKAGMKRLGFDISQTVDLPIVPAPGQGTLGIEIRKEDSKVKKLIQPLHHLPTEIVSKAEREVMRLLGGGCNLPLGVLAKLRDKQMELSIFISDLEGKTIIHETMSGFASDPILLAQKMVTILKDNGANSLMS